MARSGTATGARLARQESAERDLGLALPSRIRVGHGFPDGRAARRARPSGRNDSSSASANSRPNRRRPRLRPDTRGACARQPCWPAARSPWIALVLARDGRDLSLRWAHKASLVAEAKQREAQAYLREAQITAIARARQSSRAGSGRSVLKILLALEALPDAKEEIDRPVVVAAQEILSKRDQRSARAGGARWSHRRRPGRGGHAGRGPHRHRLRRQDRAGVGRRDRGRAAQARGPHPPRLGRGGHAGRARIVTGSGDNTARVWDASTGTELLRLKGHTRPVAAAWRSAPDGARIVTGSDDNTARVWDASTGAELLQLKGHAGPVLGVAVTPDGARIVTGSDDGTARVWDASTGAELLLLKGHTGSVWGVAVTPDGARIVTGSEDNTARVWDAAHRRRAAPAQGPCRPGPGRGGHAGRAPASSPARQDNTARVWDASTGAELLRAQGPHATPSWPWRSRRTGPASSPARTTRPRGCGTPGPAPRCSGSRATPARSVGVAVTPDGARIVTGSDDKTARVWDAGTGAELLRLKGHTGTVWGVAVTPDGARIVTGSDDKTARVWDASTGAELLRLEGHTRLASWRVAVTPDGSPHRHRLGRQDRAGVGRQDRRRAARARGPHRPVSGACGHAGRGPHRHRLGRTTPRGCGTPGPAPSCCELEGHTGPVLAAWRSRRTGPASSPALTTGPRGCGTPGPAPSCSSSRVTPAASSSVAVTPDGARIVTGSDDNTARVWDASTGAELLQLKGHTDAVSGVAVTPDGARIVTGSADNTARVWGFAQLRPPPQQHEFGTAQARQALVDRGKPSCPAASRLNSAGLSCFARGRRAGASTWASILMPPSTGKPGKPGTWRMRSIRRPPTLYGDFADAALKAGDFRTALEAAELGIVFGPEKIWITMNRAHAHMFLGRTEEARAGYLAHRGEND